MQKSINAISINIRHKYIFILRLYKNKKIKI